MHGPLIQPSHVFTREEALAAGYSADAIRHRIDRGTWLRLRHGVFVEGSAWAALAADPSRQLALEVAAVQRSLNVPVWAAGPTAATLHGADVLRPSSLLRSSPMSVLGAVEDLVTPSSELPFPLLTAPSPTASR